jgi:hypothetical protein
MKDPQTKSFAGFSFENVENRKTLLTQQKDIIFVIHFLSCVENLYLYNEDRSCFIRINLVL